MIGAAMSSTLRRAADNCRRSGDLSALTSDGAVTEFAFC
jgi:hypothetical protein